MLQRDMHVDLGMELVCSYLSDPKTTVVCGQWVGGMWNTIEIVGLRNVISISKSELVKKIIIKSDVILL